ncbi:MAG TPA: rod shape-determining protein MreC [Desulfobacteraceae bacterium]|nr:rod shape-determining protein MreC [Desulfobacteraceae bacterium]
MNHPIRDIYIWILSFIFCLVIISLGVGDLKRWTFIERVGMEVLFPIQSWFNRIVLYTENFWNRYIYLIHTEKENIRLRRQIQRLKMENYALRERVERLGRLEQMFRVRANLRWPTVYANVIGRDPTGWFKIVFLDRGSEASIEVDFPVINQDGVVGKVISVAPFFSKVLLLNDPNSAIDCLVQRSRAKGILKGMGSDIGSLEYVESGADIKIGDIIITSGMDGVFPKGIPIGKVISLKRRQGDIFQDVKVRLLVSFSRLEEVLVILKEGRSHKG